MFLERLRGWGVVRIGKNGRFDKRDLIQKEVARAQSTKAEKKRASIHEMGKALQKRWRQLTG